MDTKRFAEKYVGKIIRIWDKEINRQSDLDLAFKGKTFVDGDFLVAEKYILSDVYEVPNDVMLELIDYDGWTSSIEKAMKNPDYVIFKMLSEVDIAFAQSDIKEFYEEG